MSGRTGREENSPIHVADAIRMRELSLRLRSGDERSAEHQARGGVLAVATHDGDVERLAEDERVKFNLREDVGRDYRPSEEREEGESEDRSWPRDDCRSQENHNIPNRVVMRQEVPSARADTNRRENLLPTHTKETQEDTANISRQRASSREITGTLRRGRSEPVIDES